MLRECAFQSCSIIFEVRNVPLWQKTRSSLNKAIAHYSSLPVLFGIMWLLQLSGVEDVLILFILKLDMARGGTLHLNQIIAPPVSILRNLSVLINTRGVMGFVRVRCRVTRFIESFCNYIAATIYYLRFWSNVGLVVINLPFCFIRRKLQFPIIKLISFLITWRIYDLREVIWRCRMNASLQRVPLRALFCLRFELFQVRR